MRLRTIISATAAAVGGSGMLAASLLAAPAFATAANNPQLVSIAPGELSYYSTAEALRDGMPVAPPRVTARFAKPLQIMKRQVSQAEYAECVQDKGCRPLDKQQRDKVAADVPVVGVSWQDATDYAAWYSKRTGNTYRLPTYEEWAHAAGEVFKEDKRLDIYSKADPAQRWLAEYALEAQRKAAADPVAKPFGTYGSNAAGVQDMAGNVWEWTNTCQIRMYLGPDDQPLLPPNENCGIRVVAGSHFSMITDFMRDPKSGACSVGIPPSNLGIRLIRD